MAKTSRLILVILFGLILRLVNINQSLWLDEAAQATMSARSVSYILFERGGDFHPPLFYLLAHYWMQISHSDIWLRLLPISFGVLTIYLVYIIAKKLFPDESLTIFGFKVDLPLLAAFFTAINPFLIYYSQEFRSYSLLALLGTLSMYYLYTGRYIRTGLVNTLLLYTHYSCVFFFIAQLGYILFYKRRDFPRLILGFVITLFLFLPWLPQFLTQLKSGSNIDTYLPGWKQVLSISPLKALPVIIFKFVAGRISFLSKYIYGVYIIFTFTVTFLSFWANKKHRSFLNSWFWAPLLSLIFFSILLPQSQPFRVIYVLPALILVFTKACQRFPKLLLTLIIYISLVGNTLYFTRPRLQREQWRSALEFLAQTKSPVVIKFPGKFAPIDWYTPGLNTIDAVPTFPAKPQEVASRLAVLSGQAGPVYLMEYLTGLTDPQREVDLALQNLGFKVSGTYNYEGVGFIHEYVKK